MAILQNLAIKSSLREAMSLHRFTHYHTLLLSLILLSWARGSLAAEPCRIRVVDAENGWPVPMVELRTVHNVSFFTDNAGVIAFDLPELMNVEAWFSVESDGYELPPDGFGYRGFRFVPSPGGEHTIELQRTAIAKRLGRLTGAGLFGESQKLGDFSDWKESGVLGSDSVFCTHYRGRLYWIWGDTLLARNPLGLYHTPAATTDVAPLDHFEPPIRLPFDYYRDKDGRPRNVANFYPDEKGPTWLTGCVSLRDAAGREHWVGSYSKIEAPLTAYRVGLCEWNESKENFELVVELWDRESKQAKPASLPEGHPVLWREQGHEWVLFGDPFPSLKIPATYEAWRDPDQWQPLSPPEELADIEGKAIKVHRGSIAWNEHRKRWIAIFCQVGGKTSLLGEIWYAEAPSPLGPWGTAVQVLSHRKLSFYNPCQHPYLFPKGADFILFEGTYTHTFSGEVRQTPRYDYNQILYRLDLDDRRLAPARGD